MKTKLPSKRIGEIGKQMGASMKRTIPPGDFIKEITIALSYWAIQKYLDEEYLANKIPFKGKIK